MTKPEAILTVLATIRALGKIDDTAESIAALESLVPNGSGAVKALLGMGRLRCNGVGIYA